MDGGAGIAHIFANGGSFTVTLTVTDTNGASDTERVTINVAAPPLPPELGADATHGFFEALMRPRN